MRRDPPHRPATRVHLGGLGVPYAFEDLVRSIERSRVDGLHLLAALAQLGTTLGTRDIHGKPPFSTVTIAIAMAATLAATPDWKPFAGKAVPGVEPELLAALCARALAAEGEEVGAAPDEAHDPLVAYVRIALRIYGLQTLLQAEVEPTIARTSILGGSVDAPAFGLRAEPEFDSLLSREFGFGADDLLSAYVGLWVMMQKNPCFHLPTLLARLGPESVAARALRAVVARLSIPAQEASTQLGEHPLANCRGLARAFGLFATRPLVRVGTEHYVSAPHPFVRMATGLALVADVRTAAASENHYAARPQSNRYTVILGERMAIFAIGIFTRAMPEAEILDTHGDELSQGLPDAVFRDADGEWAVLVEAKARAPSTTVLLAPSHPGFLRAFKDVFPAMLAQMIRQACRLDGGTPPNRSPTPEAIEASRRVTSARRLLLVGVMPICPAGLHLPNCRALIVREAEALLNEEQRSWFNGAVASGRLAGWTIDGMDAFELFAARRVDEHLADAVAGWLAAVEQGMAQGYPSDEMAPTLRDHLARSWADRTAGPLPEIVDAHRTQMARVLATYERAFAAG